MKSKESGVEGRKSDYLGWGWTAAIVVCLVRIKRPRVIDVVRDLEMWFVVGLLKAVWPSLCELGWLTGSGENGREVNAASPSPMQFGNSLFKPLFGEEESKGSSKWFHLIARLHQLPTHMFKTWLVCFEHSWPGFQPCCLIPKHKYIFLDIVATFVVC